MKVLDVTVTSYAPDTGHQLKYLIEIDKGVLKRRTAYYNKSVLSKDSDNKELLEKVLKAVRSFNYKKSTLITEEIKNALR